MLADSAKSLEDDSFLDWETRDESIPFHKHIIAGTNYTNQYFYRFVCRNNGARRDVSSRHGQSILPSINFH